MSKEHCIGRSQPGNLVKTSPDEINGCFREFIGWQIGRIAINNGLTKKSQYHAKTLDQGFVLTLSWLKILS